MGTTADSAPIALLVAHTDALPGWVDSLGLTIIQKTGKTSLKRALAEAGANVALAIEKGLAIALASERGPRSLTPQETVLCLLYAIGHAKADRTAVVVTTVADFCGLEDLAAEWGISVVRTLPAIEQVNDELAGRAEEIAFGATVEEGELELTLDDETMRLACTALVDALRQGLDLSGFLSDRLYGRRYHTGDVHVNLGSPVDCALRLMDIRTDENRLFCHMMVDEPVDYLPGLPMPGDEERHLRSSDLIDWTLSDTSHVVFMADESRDDVVVRIQAHGDSLAEADIVYEALAIEAVAYVRQGPQDLSEED